MANAMVALANITLGSSAASVTFASIPTTGYRDLYIVANVVAAGQYLNMTVNSDTGANYGNVVAYGTGTGTGSYSGSTDTRVGFASVLDSTTPCTFTINIMDYAQTDKHKSMISRVSSVAGGSTLSMQANRWANTAAITTIQFTRETGGTLSAGSTFSLYGIVS